MMRPYLYILAFLLAVTGCSKPKELKGDRKPGTPPVQSPIPNPGAPGTTAQNMEVDSELGIGWFVSRGKITTIKQSRDEADDDRWSENVDNCEAGFEATMIAKSIGIADDGHFAMKQGGSNHSGDGAEDERWLDTGVRSDGKIQLQWEGPHPKNHDFDLDAQHLFIKDIGKELEGNWVGLKWAQTILSGKGGSPAKGGVRWQMWVNTDIDSSGKPDNSKWRQVYDGKPDNSKWRQVYDFVDGKDEKVIQPQDFVMNGTMDVEVRRSGTKKHEVYKGGLHVRAPQ
jgi:hypothetical protein